MVLSSAAGVNRPFPSRIRRINQTANMSDKTLSYELNELEIFDTVVNKPTSSLKNKAM